VARRCYLLYFIIYDDDDNNKRVRPIWIGYRRLQDN
jgi:hypothetical protein